jgi:hypothetical protein
LSRPPRAKSESPWTDRNYPKVYEHDRKLVETVRKDYCTTVWEPDGPIGVRPEPQKELLSF